MAITIYQLIERHTQKNPNSIFFEHATLRAFGESINQMKVLGRHVRVTDIHNNEHVCYVVSSRRWKTETVHYYFDTTSYKLINPKRW